MNSSMIFFLDFVCSSFSSLIASLIYSNSHIKDTCISRPPALALRPPHPLALALGPILYLAPGPQFVFTGPG